MLSLMLAAAVIDPSPPALERVTVGKTAVTSSACSTLYGCEIVLPTGETLQSAVTTDPRVQVVVLAKGGLTGARIKLLPPSADVHAEIDVVTDVREYRVAIAATSKADAHVLQFVYPPPPPAPRVVNVPVPAPLPTATPGTIISLGDLDYGWHSRGTSACVSIFSVRDRGQIWCVMADWLLDVPAVYLEQGKARIPIDSRVVNGKYLVMQTLSAPLQLQWPNGQTMEIDRGR